MPILEYKSFHRRDRDGNEEGGRTVDPEDIVAAGGVVVAVIIALGIVFQSVPLNVYSVGILGIAGAAGGVAKILQAKRKSVQAKRKKKS
jgi:hypothetical protein